MENEHVLGGLTRKRAEIAGQIEHTQATLRKLVADLDAIDAAIRIFDPEADIGAIKAKAYPPRHAAFRGEMMRHVMGCLRMASEPVTSRDIATGTQARRCRAICDYPQARWRMHVEAEASRLCARDCDCGRVEGVDERVIGKHRTECAYHFAFSEAPVPNISLIAPEDMAVDDL
jgi:hypothetical protein